MSIQQSGESNSPQWHLPRVVPVKQHFPRRALPDLAREIRKELAAKAIGAELPAGSNIAIAVGSRGIAKLPEIVSATVAHFRAVGLNPFIVPGMGSHGGGTAEGQRKVLAQLGVTEAQAGCRIVSSVETVDFGTTPDGIETFLDRSAAQSDGVFLVNRIKWHTSFESPVESGLVKMAAIGLGKVEGARNYHQHALRNGLAAVIRSVGRHVLASGKVIGGLAVVEDAHHEIGKVAAERADGIASLEMELLPLARSWMARILFDEIDILMVDEMGKQFSGTGMDSKIINRHPHGGAHPWSWAPHILKIYVRDLSPASYGNAVGIGMADVISEQLYSKIDWTNTLVNARTASNLAAIRTPFRAANDKEALQLLSSIVGRPSTCATTLVWIRNTLELNHILVSETLLAESGSRHDIEVTGSALDLSFDSAEDLVQPKVHEYAVSTMQHPGSSAPANQPKALGRRSSGIITIIPKPGPTP